MFWKPRRQKARDLHQQVKMEESQRVLLSAATQTANAAHAVTTLLKARLDDSLRQFEYTARLLNDALVVCDLDGTIRASNPAARHMFGERSLVGSSVLELFDLDGGTIPQAEVLWDMIARTSRWSHKDPSPLRGRKPGCGTLLWIEPACATLDWSDGTASMILILRNVTPTLALQTSARDAKRRFQAAFDLAFDGMLVAQDGRIVAANTAVVSLFGHAMPDLMNRPVSDLFVPEEHDIVESPVVDGAFTVHGQHASGALRTILFSAADVMWLSQSARLITLKDVTGLGERDAPQPYLDNGIDLICRFDASYRIVFTNDAFARLHHCERATLLGQDVRDYLGKQPREEFEARLDDLTLTNPSARIQVEESTETVRDWIDHAVFNDAGAAIEFQRVGRDLPVRH